MINKIKNKGFTVLESIVAIAILSLSVSGAFSAVGQSFSNATIAKDEVRAFYLAQEAMEIIRNKRDTNQLAIINGAGVTWLTGITDICLFSTVIAKKTCKIDAKSFQISLCGAGDWDNAGCPVLNQDPDTFLYSYGAYPPTNFKREIQIESINADEIAITVRVSWTKGSLPPFVFKIKEHLFKWI